LHVKQKVYQVISLKSSGERAGRLFLSLLRLPKLPAANAEKAHEDVDSEEITAIVTNPSGGGRALWL
jgi:hypothetical protein